MKPEHYLIIALCCSGLGIAAKILGLILHIAWLDYPCAFFLLCFGAAFLYAIHKHENETIERRRQDD